ncbi:protein Cep78 homolog [Drosophila grimshawi]|uniref:GH18933 n=1 Tax=Drosophila grimshawi TaxID=7222 RepID=B4JH61_DROGR|nr:protein Cep78 homolog [Drosophila grimshawi]EDV92752.1 GH18933 [Drosophila grimshawi]
MSFHGRDVKKRPSVVVSVPPLVKKSSKSRSFHFRYLELCRAKNLTPVPNLRANPNATTYLDLLGDKLGVTEWLLIIEALHHDLVLQTLIVRMRRANGDNVIQPIDSENRARLFRQKPVIYTRFIFSSLVEAIANCIQFNKNLTILKLEGLPLQDGYIECIAKSLASNDCIKEVSFQKSLIGDKGCEAVCSTVKYLNHVEIFNLCECNISSKGAEFVADMIKMQKITRFSEGWEMSLRYRSVDVNSISGLRTVALANNPNLGDEGVRHIAEVLKEDAWVKTIDMENCGLTDRGANFILECLELNKALTEFNLRNNNGISKFIMRQIRDHFGKEDEDKLKEPQYDLSCVNGLQSLPKNQKYSISQLLQHTRQLEEQLSLERTLRKKAEKLNEKLNQKLMSLDLVSPSLKPLEKIVEHENGYCRVKSNIAKPFVKSIEEAPQALVNSTVTSMESSPRSDTLRNQQQYHQVHLFEEQHEEDAEDEEAEEVPPMTANSHRQMRQQLQVRKVRSEMKYVETFSKEKAKKRESKSDHEFANERDFKLNPNVQFEMDIGDSCLVNEQQEHKRNEHRQDANYDNKYGHNNSSQYGAEHIGDGVRSENHKRMSKMKKQQNGEQGNSHMALYMAELERKINGKSGKKRHKSKMQHGNKVRENKKGGIDDYVQVESYMANMEESSLLDNGETSDEEKTDSTICTEQEDKFEPMKVYLRRTQYEEDELEVQDNQDAGGHMMSPRSVYLEMQRKMNESNQ